MCIRDRPVGDVTAIICFIGDGFLVDRMIEPDLPDELYTTVVSVFLRGLQAMADEQGER